MSDLNTISEKLGTLSLLATKDDISLDDIHQEFRQDLMTFIQGETLSRKDNKIRIGRNLYNKWLLKLKIKGFDYEIQF